MLNPELLTAYGVAGVVVATMMLTAFKIIRDSNPDDAAARREPARAQKAFWPPLAPGRR